MVLEYSLKKHSSLPIELTFMKISDNITSPWGGWDTQLWATPFSGFRWSIPEVCNFAGKGVYMDSDMIILSDIAKLWNQSFDAGKVVLTKGGEQTWRYCVCMWNNAFARDFLLPLERMKANPDSHRRMMNYFSTNQEIVQPFKGNWNCVDMENFKNFDNIDILHYSDMATQPHLRYAIPRLQAIGKKHWFDGELKTHWRPEVVSLFDQYYNEALEAGYKVENYIPKTPWIEYNKESQKGYQGHSWSR